MDENGNNIIIIKPGEEIVVPGASANQAGKPKAQGGTKAEDNSVLDEKPKAEDKQGVSKRLIDEHSKYFVGPPSPA